MSYTWDYTHISVNDGSPARLVSHATDHRGLFENEDGDQFVDLLDLWEPRASR